MDRPHDDGLRRGTAVVHIAGIASGYGAARSGWRQRQEGSCSCPGNSRDRCRAEETRPSVSQEHDSTPGEFGP